MRTLCLAAVVALVPASLRANETLQITLETDAGTPTGSPPDYRPQTLVVIWLERDCNDGAWSCATGDTHVATLARWGTSYAHNLRDWSAATGFGSDGVNLDDSRPVDGLTEATVPCYTGQTFDSDDGDSDGCGYSGTCQLCRAYGDCHACSTADVPATLDTGAVDITGIPDGTYNLQIELGYTELPGPTTNDRITISFTKDGIASTASPADSTTMSNIAVTYSGRSGSNRPGVYAGPDAWVSPSSDTASLALEDLVTDDGTPTVTWNLVEPSPEVPPCVTFDTSDPITTTVNFCRSGIFVLGLTADDGQATTSDELTVYVNAQRLTPVADTRVDSGNPDTAYGSDPILWTSDNNRTYVRFDLSTTSATVVEARLLLHGVESIFTDNDRVVRLIENDSWDGSLINWNNQPLANGNYALGITAGSFLPEFGLQQPALTTSALQSRWFLDDTVSFFIGPETADPEWMGILSGETFSAPELVVIEAWDPANSAPSASADVTPSPATADASGMATIALDSTSTDPDDNLWVWEWRDGASVAAYGANTNLDLALGFHDITLHVEDALGANDTTGAIQVLVDDRHAGNNTSGSAASLTPGTYDQLFAHDTAGDWFLVNLAADGGLEVDIAFSHADGNLDLTVFASDGTTNLAESTSTDDDESVSLSALSAGNYLIRVNAQSGSAAYSMTVATTGAPTLTVSFNQGQVLESAGTVTDIGTVTVSVAPSADLAVTLAASPTGHLTPESPVTIPAGQTSVDFDVTVTDDAVEEADTTVTVTATAVAHTAGSNDIVVRDDDGPLPMVSWASANQTVSETAGQATVTVTMTAASDTDVIVPFTLSGTATGGGVDYTIGQTQITIPGDGSTTEGSISIVLIDDAAVEGDEDILFTMGTDVEITGATRTDPILHLITITDDESVTPDGGPPTDGGGSGDSGTTGGDPAPFVPQSTVLVSSGCACRGGGAPASFALFAVWLARVRRRQSRATGR